MTAADDVPYADPQPLADLVEECRCVEAECSAHGIDLHPGPPGHPHPHPAPIVIGDAAQRIVDDYPEYGS